MGKQTPTIVALDTSALLAMITDGPARATVLDSLKRHDLWCASDIALAEGIPAIDRLTDEQVLRDDLEDSFRYLWDWLHTVPVDARCLDDAAHLARQVPARMSDAIHLAAAMRLPQPTSFVTLDPAQLGLAEYVGLHAISP